MELVYLWVEEYKNIQKQGFNFSPRFACHYDEDSNELTIDKKNDHIDIFPKDINVTAIVGENGSGKSNIAESLITLLSDPKARGNEECKIAAIYHDGSSYCCKSWNCDGLKVNANLCKDVEKTKNFTMYFNYTLDFAENDCLVNFNNYYHKTDGYETPILLIPSKPYGRVDISNIQYLINRQILDFTIRNDNSFANIERFFVPKKFRLTINPSKVYKKLDSERLFPETLVEPIEHTMWRYLKDKNFKFEKSLNELSVDEIKNLNHLYIIKKAFNKKKFIKDDNYKMTIQNIQTTNNEKEFEKLMEIQNKKDFSKLFSEEGYELAKIKNSFKFFKFLKKRTQKLPYKPTEKYNIKEDHELLLHLPAWIDISFYDKDDISLDSLSYGQKFLIRFLYTVLYQLRNLSDKEYPHITLVIDEVEQGLHPNWQKEYINFIVTVLKSYKERFSFNIICLTHSPFILSDLPKENVIFLKDGKQVDVDIDTFGANIHTLLSHGFFMENGLMGEFAKSKIDKAIKYLNQKTLDSKEIDYCENIISIIGEPILKRQLQKMLDSKRLYKVDDINKKIKDMEYELSVLKKYQKKATHDELKDRAKRKYSKNKSDEDE